MGLLGQTESNTQREKGCVVTYVHANAFALELVLQVLYPFYLDMRFALNVGRTCKHNKQLTYDLVTSHASMHIIPARWRKTKRIDRFVSVPTLKGLTLHVVRSYGAELAAVNCILYQGLPKTAERVYDDLRFRHCRECTLPSASFALTSSGLRVIVCRSCSNNSDSFSHLVDRKKVAEMFAQCKVKPFGLRCLFKKLRLARKSQNRAFLYWFSEVRFTLAEMQSRPTVHWNSIFPHRY